MLCYANHATDQDLAAWLHALEMIAQLGTSPSLLLHTMLVLWGIGEGQQQAASCST